MKAPLCYHLPFRNKSYNQSYKKACEMESLYGIFLYGVSLFSLGLIYALLALGLNLQWGFTGLFNAGVAGFFAIGAYTTAILTTNDSIRHFGGFDLSYIVSFPAAVILAGLIAFMIGKVCLRLKSDYLAIATLGIAMVMQLILKNEIEFTNGSRGISQIPKPFEGLAQPFNELAFLALIIVFVVIVYYLLEVARKSPWGRVLIAVRENEESTKAAGKNVQSFRMQGFVIGAMIMALAGVLMAHYLKFIEPTATDPVHYTFLVWVMLIMGGSGNNRGAIVGAMLMWFIWSASELLTSALPPDWASRSAYLRIFIIGLVLQFILQKFSQGILPEQRPS